MSPRRDSRGTKESRTFIARRPLKIKYGNVMIQVIVFRVTHFAVTELPCL